jgi:hypothetical protein
VRSEQRRNTVEAYYMGQRFHLALLILGEVHNQRQGHRFEPLHLRAVEIDVGDLVAVPGRAVLCNGLVRIGDVAQRRFDRRIARNCGLSQFAASGLLWPLSVVSEMAMNWLLANKTSAKMTIEIVAIWLRQVMAGVSIAGCGCRW